MLLKKEMTICVNMGLGCWEIFKTTALTGLKVKSYNSLLSSNETLVV
jgi:hypothetical protein